MAATGTLGARLYTSATPLTNLTTSCDAIGDFQGLTIATELGLIENLGDFGKQFEMVNFVAVSDGRTYKFKGAYNEGAMDLMVAQDLSDSGQAALLSYGSALDQNTYPFKITIVGADASYDTIYFGAKVMSFRTSMGAVNSIIKASIRLEINTPTFIGAS